MAYVIRYRGKKHTRLSEWRVIVRSAYCWQRTFLIAGSGSIFKVIVTS